MKKFKLKDIIKEENEVIDLNFGGYELEYDAFSKKIALCRGGKILVSMPINQWNIIVKNLSKFS